MTKDTEKYPEEGSLEEMRSQDILSYFSGVGHPHPISEGVKNLRSMLIETGFDEIQTSYFVERKDVKELTGKLYPVFKDSVYHLSWIKPKPLPPTFEIDRKIAERFPEIDRAELWNILDTLDEDTSGEELMFDLRDELSIPVDDAIEIMNMIPGLTKGDPATGDITLRSFMPTTWLSTLEATFNADKLPIRLFTIASAFRREPTPDSNHIETYNILSLAIGDPGITLEKGMGVLRKLFDNLDLKEINFKKKSYPFPFYKKGSEMELFGGDLELGTCGMVSKKVLDSRGVDIPVFIADIGVERTLMFRHGYPDIRELLYPQFYAAWKLTDEEIASSIRYVRRPQTDYGKEIAQSIHKTYRENQEKGLTKKVAWKGILVSSDYGRFLVGQDRAKELKLEGKQVEIILKEVSEGMGLSGPAAFNEIWIEQGNILGVPPSTSKKMEERGAFRTNKSYVKAFSRFAAWKIERSLERGQTMRTVKKIKDLEGINMKLTSKALYYMLSHKKKVDTQGPVYLKFSFKIKDD